MFQAPTKDEARARIITLVKNFERQLPDYQRGTYNETQTRRDFIDPFFQALGWDIDNSSGAAEAYREVIHEDKVKVGKATKAPDYSFRLPGGQRLFFVEAKKPSVKIKEEILPAYQVRRYGWSAKLALSILTDFEELAVYDCTLQPSPTDKAAKGRLKYLTFREYATEFDFLWDTFSKESVLRGGLDRFVATGSGKRGKETVDAAFLTTLEAMRAELAQGLATRNRRLDADELRFLVQMLLDRIIFLRIAEDRGIEPYQDLQAIAGFKKKDAVYLGLLDSFKAAAARYNSGLFDLDKDTLSAEVRLDNAVLAPLLRSLYYPESPYEFSVIGAEILGSAYERFLGKVISLEPGRVVRIDDKPEVRKAGGVFYTPAYIVDYIVAATLGPRCAGRTPPEVARLRVLDPACGSGSFLLGAYQCLLDWHLAYYQAHPTAALPPVPTAAGKAAAKAPPRRGGGLTPDGRLSSAVKKAILLNNLYGVDLDAQAVEVTKLSLLLKCLEGETSASIQHALGLERVLPTIDQNIRVGNSLVETDFYDGEIDFAPGTEKTVKPFGWRDEFAAVFQQGGFDVVIGNPPYVRPHNIEPEVKNYLRPRYQTFEKKADLYCCFFEKGLQVLKKQGVLSFIVGNGWLRLDSFQATRQYLLTHSRVSTIIDFTDYVFQDAAVKTMIAVLTKETQASEYLIETTVLPCEELRAGQEVFSTIAKSSFESSYKNIFDLSTTSDSLDLQSRLQTECSKLGDSYQINFGLKTGDDSRFLTKQMANSDHKPLLRGADIHRYQIEFKGEYVWYVPDQMKQHRKTARPGTASRFEQPKILIRDTGGNLEGTYDDKSYFVKDVLVITPLIAAVNAPQRTQTAANLKFLCGLLNSRFLRHYYETSFPTLHVQRDELASLPIPKLNLETPADKKKHDELVSLVDQLLAGYAGLAAHKLTSAKEQAQARLRHLERRLDGLVYDLYQLTEEEKAHVAGGAAG